MVDTQDWRTAKHLDLDALVVGGGFGGLYTLHRLRKRGLEAKVFEAGKELGGVWHWNRKSRSTDTAQALVADPNTTGYPGARVDSEVPYYQYSLHEVWKDWSWSERFPADEELRHYFKHAAEKMEVNDHIKFSESIVDCTWDTGSKQWVTKTATGTIVRCTYLVAAAGSSYKHHYPDIPGLKRFGGVLVHAAGFPEGGIDFHGKKVAVIGQGIEDPSRNSAWDVHMSDIM